MGLYMRRDQLIVTVVDVPGYWNRCLGGEVRFDEESQEVVIDPLVLGRLRRDEDLEVLEGLWGHVGQAIVVRLEHWDPDGNATGYGILYEGRLTSVRPSEPDANSCDVVADEITVAPDVIRRVAPDREPQAAGR